MEHQTYTLEDFVIEHVATDEEWQDWLRVRNAQPPRTRAIMPTDSFGEIYHEQLPPSDDFVRKGELARQFCEGVRALLLSGQWETWVRLGPPQSRQRLEPIDLERGEIDFARNAIPPYHSVSIVPASPKSKVGEMKQFIEAVCLAVGNPGTRVTKPLINSLAMKLRPEAYSTTAFAAAWDEAGIDERWRKSGPR